MLCTGFYTEGGKNAYASVFAEHSSLLPMQDRKIQSLFDDFQHTFVSKWNCGHDLSVAYTTVTLVTSLSMTHLDNCNPFGQQSLHKQGLRMWALERKH